MMTNHEIDEFLAGRFVGALASIRKDGSPNAVPIWFRWHEGTIRMWSDPEFGWVMRVRTEPRVAFTVFEHDVPRRAVYIRGHASVREGSMDELNAEIRAITARYVDPDRLDAEVESYDRGKNKVIVTITPDFIKGEVNS